MGDSSMFSANDVHGIQEGLSGKPGGAPGFLLGWSKQIEIVASEATHPLKSSATISAEIKSK